MISLQTGTYANLGGDINTSGGNFSIGPIDRASADSFVHISGSAVPVYSHISGASSGRLVSPNPDINIRADINSSGGTVILGKEQVLIQQLMGAGTFYKKLDPSKITSANSNINTGGGNLVISGEMTLEGDGAMDITAGEGAVLFQEEVDIGENELSVSSSNLTRIRPGAKFSGTTGLIDLNADQMILIQEDIRLSGAGSVKMSGGSIILTKDKSIVAPGGDIALEGGADSITLIDGALDVSTQEEGQSGGSVKVLGGLVGLLDDASIYASGHSGGGEVLIGGDYQGGNDVPTSSITFVDKGAVIKADAYIKGDGGKVITWADDGAYFYGNISARGGLAGGDGGFVEVSGKQNLVYEGVVDTSSPLGEMGTLLLDPTDIYVVADGQTADLSLVDQFSDADFAGSGGVGGHVVINEVNTGGPDHVELYNYGSSVNLSGWKWYWHDNRGYGGTFTLPSFTLASGKFVEIDESSGSHNSSTIYMGSNMMWTSSGSRGIAGELRDNTGKVIDFFRMVGDPTTPTGGTGWNSPDITYPASNDVARRFTDNDTDSGSDWTVGGNLTVNSLNPGQTGVWSGGGGCDGCGAFTKITASAINNSASNVVLQAENDIYFDTSLTMVYSGKSITAQAKNDIFVNYSITTNNGAIVLTADHDNSGSGAMTVDGNLTGSSIGTEGARALAKSQILKNLKELRVGHNQLGTEGVELLASSPYLTQLEILDLSENGVGPGAMKALIASAWIYNLKELLLNKNQIFENRFGIAPEGPLTLPGPRDGQETPWGHQLSINHRPGAINKHLGHQKLG